MPEKKLFGLPKCGHCGGVGTEIKIIKPQHSDYLQAATICKSCNAIIALSDYPGIGALLESHESAKFEIITRLNSLEEHVRQLTEVMKRQ
ncbi:hypothetical protein KXR64_21015 [Brucella intermedia]|uniref:hypothetical protein n=1 Tax=Brucella TaxID=234 RepID=UPI0009468044|nr:hypothetical protein [Brucella intermedia]